MALVNMKDLLSHAYRNRYAVGAFEIVSLEFLQAVIQAAEKSRSPVILNIVETHASLYELEFLLAAVMHAARNSSVPIAVHMDHCRSAQSVQTAMRLGCNSVMFDASRDSFPENVDKTKNVVRMAHACGLPVEGELGYVGASDKDPPTLTSAQQARAYVERTQVDFLAVSIGTTHGRAVSSARLDYTRLGKIKDAVDIPLVVHGGSGLNDKQYHKLIDNGVAKINYFTALADHAVSKLAENFQGEMPVYSDLFDGMVASICDEVARCMQVWRSAGRAAEVLIQCSPWRNVEHVIVYNPDKDEPEIIYNTLVKGKRDLSRIPGVLAVQIGRRVDPKGKYQYCWLIRFAHSEVIASYKTHPLHVAYADNYFRPLATDRITVDYEIIDDISLKQMLPRAEPA